MQRAGAARANVPGLLYGQGFDTSFIWGTAALGVASALAVVLQPNLFMPILFIDLWLLGYHHVISTYTRLCFDRGSVEKYKFLIFGLLPMVFAAVFLITATAGIWMVVTIYLYWQWFHYTRQSYGIAQAYRRAAGGIDEDERLSHLVFYMLPLWGILSRANQGSEKFLGLDVAHPPVPDIVVQAVGIAAVAGMIWWAITRIRLWRAGRLPVGHTLYVISHFAVFYIGYIAIESIDAGWVAINVWHNAQYIAFVWLQNNRRYREGIEPRARFVSWLSQKRNVIAYFAVCLAISTTVYATLQWTVASVAMLVIIFQTINFHHYIVDSIIWRSPRRKTPVPAEA